MFAGTNQSGSGSLFSLFFRVLCRNLLWESQPYWWWNWVFVFEDNKSSSCSLLAFPIQCRKSWSPKSSTNIFGWILTFICLHCKAWIGAICKFQLATETEYSKGLVSSSRLWCILSRGLKWRWFWLAFLEDYFGTIVFAREGSSGRKNGLHRRG